MQRLVIILCLMGMLVSGCTTTPEPTPTPEPSATASDTPTASPAPTRTPAPPTATVDVVSVLAPEGEPAAEWEGIPIMPGALQGEDKDGSYAFTIDASPEEVQAYYESELPRLGITSFAVGTNPSGSPSMLMYMDGAEIITISILPYEGIYLIWIVK